jgi:serine/threonine-protein kinase
VAHRFRLERFIAQGGMGVLWEATDTLSFAPSAERVALKILSAPFGGPTEVARERFRREAVIASRLTDRHFPRLIAASVDPGADPPFIAMELLRGETLARRLLACGRLPVGECVATARRIAEGLAEPHALGIVHRDLSPQNIFLLEDGDLKILDFGLATHAPFDTTLTEAGAFMGTPHFMSPEQLRSAHDVDTRADLWALSAILYRCLLGRPPFQGKPTEVLLKILGETPDSPSCLAAVPPSVDAFFESALAKDPARRYPSAERLVDAFEQAVAGLTKSAPVPARELPVAAPNALDVENDPRTLMAQLPEIPALLPAVSPVAWADESHPQADDLDYVADVGLPRRSGISVGWLAVLVLATGAATYALAR